MKSRYYIALLASLLIPACDDGTSSGAYRPRVTFAPDVHQLPFGQYRVHVNALTTDQLPQEIALAYGIERGKNRALLNVSVREKTAGAETAVAASLNVMAKNLNNQLKAVKLREIKEPALPAIYYIGELAVAHQETVVFDLDITPATASRTIYIRYRQQFFTEQ